MVDAKKPKAARKPRTKKAKPAPVKALSALAGLKAQLLSSTSTPAIVSAHNAKPWPSRAYDDGPTTLTREQVEYALHRAGA